MILYVKVKNVYGKELLYPDCQESKFICELARTKTITDQLKRKLLADGYKLALKPQEIAYVR
jgi:hypothetical protein